jgi:cytochrome c peroxidase
MKKLVVFGILTFVSMAFYLKPTQPLAYPEYFPAPHYDFSENSFEPAKVELGRLLFYDPLLSKDSSISCASCHSPFNAFAHTDHDLSHGLNDAIGLRNAPALFNLAWQKDFMWDGAATRLDLQALAPLTHPDEMGESLEGVLKKLSKSSFYKRAFKETWGDTLINSLRLFKSLAQFQLSLVSANAKYDLVQHGTAFFTEQEARGYALFKTHCNSCHSEPLFSNYAFSTNGLSIDSTLNDYGRMMVTQRNKDSLHFKTPSLRNLSYSYPYMHDGRFQSLREVLKHYSGTLSHKELLPEALRKPLAIGKAEQTDLISFLLTLNDSHFVFNPQHRFPKQLLNQENF